MKTASNFTSPLRNTMRIAHQFEDSIYQIAQVAMRDTNPHLVAHIMQEHDKINAMLKRLHNLVDNLSYTAEAPAETIDD